MEELLPFGVEDSEFLKIDAGIGSGYPACGFTAKNQFR